MNPELWQPLMRAAMLGAGRQKLELPAADGALGALFDRISGLDAETSLLAAAGALALYERAGHQPERSGSPFITPAREETLPRCSNQAAYHLSLFLSGKFSEIFPEWLTAAVSAGLRVPEPQLPALLDQGRRERRLRPHILPVLGERGVWLAALNPEWKWAAHSEPDQEWETGSLDVRMAALAEIRSQDPTRARQMLGDVWRTERAEERAGFLPILSAGLSMEDEPFLEERLDDRSQEVRTTAAALLVRLPNSRLIRRMIERVHPLLKFVPATRAILKKSQPARIEVTLPEECDTSMIRDGVEKKARLGMGERAWWMLQMIAAIPPRFWQEEWNQPPAAILEAAADSEWADLLLQAWMQAAQRHPNEAWGEALLLAWERRVLALRENGNTHAFLLGVATPLVETLPIDPWEGLLRTHLVGEECPLCAANPLFLVLLRSSRIVGLATGRLILQSFQCHASHSNVTYWTLSEPLKPLARTLPPPLAPEAAEGWPTERKNDAAFNKLIEEFVTTLEFRREMLEELGERERNPFAR